MFEKIKFQNATNITIQGYLYVPKIKKTDILLYYFHGYGGYFTQVEGINILDEYMKQGFALCGIDMLGHGLSGGNRGQVSSFESVLEDNVKFIKLVQQKHSCYKNIVLLGHSLGGACALIIGAQFNLNIKGVVSLAPLLDIAGFKNSIIYNAIKPVKMLNKICPKLVMKPCRIKFPKLAQQFPEFKDIIVNDELIFRGSMNLNTFVQVDNLRLYCIKSAVNIKVPVLIIHGKDDDITSYKASKRLFQEMNNNNKTFIGIEGSTHYLILDSKKQMITNFILKWMKEIIK